MKAEFFSLVKDTLQLAKELNPPFAPFLAERPVILKKPPTPPIKVDTSEVKTKTIPTFSSFDEMKTLFLKVHPQIFREEIPVYVYLVAWEEKEIPFLKKVAVAISETILPAKVIVCKTEKDLDLALKSPQIKLIIARKENTTPHQLIKHKNTHLLPLEKIDNYLKDSSKKRMLWNALRNLPLADLLP